MKDIDFPITDDLTALLLFHMAWKESKKSNKYNEDFENGAYHPNEVCINNANLNLK